MSDLFSKSHRLGGMDEDEGAEPVAARPCWASEPRTVGRDLETGEYEDTTTSSSRRAISLDSFSMDPSDGSVGILKGARIQVATQRLATLAEMNEASTRNLASAAAHDQRVDLTSAIVVPSSEDATHYPDLQQARFRDFTRENAEPEMPSQEPIIRPADDTRSVGGLSAGLTTWVRVNQRRSLLVCTITVFLAGVLTAIVYVLAFRQEDGF